MTRHVLVPMDDSDPARAALEHALSLFPDDEITVLHVIDELEAGYAGRSPPAAETTEPDFFDDVRTLAEAYGTTVDATVREGADAETILEYVREEGVDQLVMGSEGRAGVSRMLLGSVAEAVARRSPVPVTIVP